MITIEELNRIGDLLSDGYLMLDHAKNEKIRDLYEETDIAFSKYSIHFLDQLSNDIYRQKLSDQKRDPYIAGGIANGLAGGAAGLFTAVDVMVKNAEIEQELQKNAEKLFHLASNLSAAEVDLMKKSKKLYYSLYSDEGVLAYINSGDFQRDLKAQIMKSKKVKITITGLKSMDVHLKIKNKNTGELLWSGRNNDVISFDLEEPVDISVGWGLTNEIFLGPKTIKPRGEYELNYRFMHFKLIKINEDNC